MIRGEKSLWFLLAFVGDALSLRPHTFPSHSSHTSCMFVPSHPNDRASGVFPFSFQSSVVLSGSNSRASCPKGCFGDRLAHQRILLVGRKRAINGSFGPVTPFL